jgi:hypothetical protein
VRIAALLYEIVDPDRDGPLRPSRRDLATLGIYTASAAAYVGIGLWTIDFVLSVWVALAYLLVTAWLVPAAVRRFL